MSMVLDHPEESDFVEQVLEVHVIDVDAIAEDNMEAEDPMLAIVPFVPPHAEQQNIIVAMIRVPAGPPLPPEMIWKRTFDPLYEEIYPRNVPRAFPLSPLKTVVCSERS